MGAATRENLRSRAAGRLAAAVAQSLARHDTAAAVTLAERWGGTRPAGRCACNSSGARVGAGRPAEGLARLEAHGRRVQEEIGRAPGAALTALAQRLRKLAIRETDWPVPSGLPSAEGRSHGVSDEAKETARTINRLLSEAPLLERDSEWRVLADAWASVADGAGAVALVQGEHGAGTSRLIRDLGRWVAGTNGTVIRTTGLEADRSVPFSTLARLVHSAIEADGAGGTDGHWLAELARLEPAMHARFPGVPQAPATSAVDGWRIFEAFAQLLTVLVADGPVLVLLDDPPWCDEETAGLIEALVEGTRNIPVLWCAAASLGIAGRDSAGARLMRSLAGGSCVRSVRPARLSVRGILDTLGTLGDESDAPRRAAAVVQQVLDESERLPLFAIALLCELHAVGALIRTANAWAPRIADDEPLPAHLTDLDALCLPIRAQFERMAEDERQALTTIALARRPCDVELLSMVNGISRLRAAVLCNSLCASGLLAEDGNTYRCAPRIVADVMRSGIGGALRRETERAIASVLGARTVSQSSVLQESDAGVELIQ